ncbi:MAG: response regulator [Elusimicrobiota bacterium]
MPIAGLREGRAPEGESRREERRPVVLAVDDDPNMRRPVRLAAELAGCGVVFAAGVEEAKKRLGEERPDLALLDMNLGDGSGLDICREMAARGLDVPALFLTSCGDVESRLRAFRAGAHDYIPKPFSVEELAARVRVHLRLRGQRERGLREGDRIHLRERVRRDLSDMIVHDVEAPLTSVLSTLKILRDERLILDEDYARLVHDCGTVGGMVLLALCDLLDMGQAEAGRFALEISRVRVADVLARVAVLLHPEAKKAAVECGIGEFEAGLTVHTDRLLLFRILANALSNAIKSSPRGGRVVMRAARHGAKVVIDISDRGPGIPDKEKRTVFDKRGGPRTGGGDREHGPRLGLAFCRAAAEVLGGMIRAEDREGGGTRFVLALPATSPPDRVPA